jgi:hypothetical protein
MKNTLTIFGLVSFSLLGCAPGLAGPASSASADFSAWKYRLPITLVHRDSRSAGVLPVDVTFSFFADRCRDPLKEVRLVLKTSSGEEEVPFQLSRISRWTKDTDGVKSLPTISGMITFFDTAPGSGDAEYFLLYGNPDAPAPAYPSDLKVSGRGPAWTVENSRMIVRLQGKKADVGESTNHDSGQLSAVVLKAKPDAPFETDENVLHWNPGVFVPTRGWIHAFAWDPPERYEIESGPVFVDVRRSGPFPLMPEVRLSVNYRIFSNRAYVESGTVLDVREDIGVVALRDDQLIFREGSFTHVGWDEGGRTATGPLEAYKPVNKHGDLLRIPADAGFVTFFYPARGVGAASVRDLFSAIGPDGEPPTLFDTATYIAHGEGLLYWFRPLVYFHVGWDREQLITVPKGSVYAERNFYLFYEPSGSRPLAEVEGLSRAVRSRPGLKIGEYALPPER